MTAQRFRSFHFVLPHVLWAQVERSYPSAGMQVTPAGRIDMVDGDESIRQSILMLLATSPGERVMRPEYGCLLHRVIFSPNDDTTAGLAIHYVRSAIDRWEPRIEILNLDARRDPDSEGRLEVLLEYRVRSSQDVRHLRVPVQLSTGAA
jgi:phage baseplate assembly protein W